MELVYLWEKGLSHNEKGFNFIENIKLSYENGKLLEEDTRLNPEDDIVSQEFFGDNLRINAVVGENGSGKSSVLKLVDELFSREIIAEYREILNIENNKSEPDKNYIFCYRLDGKIYAHSNIQELEIPKEYERTESLKSLANIVLLHSDYTTDDCDNDNLLRFENTDTEELLKYNEQDVLPITINSIEFYISKGTTDRTIKNILELLIKFDIKIKEDSKVADLLDDLNKINIEDLDDKERRIISKFKSLMELKSNKYYIENSSKSLELDNIDVEFIDKYSNNLTINYYSKHGHTLELLSHGEKTMLLLFSKLISEFYKSKNKYNMFLLDEMDLSFHPKWQKNYIDYLCMVLNKIILQSEGNKKISVLLTTHSPFVLSDIPKNNILFLKNRNQVDGIAQKKTFGANIHTLLSDGFFMGNDLIGAYAGRKINTIIEFYDELKNDINKKKEDSDYQSKRKFSKEYTVRKDEFKFSQKAIGDQYVAKVIQNHIDEIEKNIYGDQYIEEYKDNEIKKLLAQFDDKEIRRLLDKHQ